MSGNLKTYKVLIWTDGEMPFEFHYQADDALHAMEQYMDDPLVAENPLTDHVVKITVVTL